MTDNQNQDAPQDADVAADISAMFEGAIPARSFGFTFVHDRVFVTWFERHKDDDFQFFADPKAIELEPIQADQFRSLLNHHNDQMQALLEGFVEETENGGQS